MDRQAFANPPKGARPMVRWWWPGLDVRADELAREIAEMDQAGIGGAELQPLGIGLPPGLAKSDPGRLVRTHRFMQPYHYEMMQRVQFRHAPAMPSGLIGSVTLCLLRDGSQ